MQTSEREPPVHGKLVYDRSGLSVDGKRRLFNMIDCTETTDTADEKTQPCLYFPPCTAVNTVLKPEPRRIQRTGSMVGRLLRQAAYTHTLTHTAGGRCGGPAHVLPSGQAWAGSSRCIWHGFLAGRTRNPGLQRDRIFRRHIPAQRTGQTHI